MPRSGHRRKCDQICGQISALPTLHMPLYRIGQSLSTNKLSSIRICLYLIKKKRLVEGAEVKKLLVDFQIKTLEVALRDRFVEKSNFDTMSFICRHLFITTK